ncbi:7 transmembrane receptor (rhodopsin) [Mactra antiquata]
MYYRVAKVLWRTTVISAMRMQSFPDADDTSFNSTTRASSFMRDHSIRRSEFMNRSANASNSASDEPPSSIRGSGDEYNSCEQAAYTFKGNNNTTVMCGLRRTEDHQEIKIFIPLASIESSPVETDMTIRLCGQREQTSNFSRNCVSRQSSRYRQDYLSNTKRVAQARKKVVRLLISVVVTFGVCVLPHMMRVVNHYWSLFYLPHSYDTILSPISFIVLYLNSVLNPFLYAMFSTNFRRSFKEALPCFRRKKSS